MIGVFDSGVGGLTVLNLEALRRRMPDDDFVYVGDTARAGSGVRLVDGAAGVAEEVSAAFAGRALGSGRVVHFVTEDA